MLPSMKMGVRKTFQHILLILVLAGVGSSYAFGQEQQPDQNHWQIVKGILSGSVEVDSVPVTRPGIVAFFRVSDGAAPRAKGPIRVPEGVALIEEGGRFSVSLHPGAYYSGVIIGRTTTIPGPPRQGEQSLVANDEQGNPRIFVVMPGQKTDVGKVSGKSPDFSSELEASLFTVQGVVTDEAGRPIAQARVIAFEEDQQGRRLPAFIQPQTENDGRYEMKLAPGKAYIIVARTGQGWGPPSPGDRMGQYGPEIPIPVSGKAGEVLKNLDIQVLEIAKPGEEQKKGS